MHQPAGTDTQRTLGLLRHPPAHVQRALRPVPLFADDVRAVGCSFAGRAFWGTAGLRKPGSSFWRMDSLVRGVRRDRICPLQKTWRGFRPTGLRPVHGRCRQQAANGQALMKSTRHMTAKRAHAATTKSGTGIPACASAESQTRMPVARWERDRRGCGARIDQLVYRLYGLTPEEIKMVEEGAQQ